MTDIQAVDATSEVGSGSCGRQVPVEDALSGLLTVVMVAGTESARRLAGLPGWALCRLARSGSVAAQRKLGYRAAGSGSPSDLDEAFQWFRQGARRGDAACQYALGVMYSNGQGVAQGKLQASLWYHKAAEQGYAAAQFNLGLAYVTGDGVNVNLARAAYWYRQAADQHYARAQFNLAILYEYGWDGEPDQEQALALYTAAANQGFGQACLRLGEIYRDGTGVTINSAESYFWFNLAARCLLAGDEYDQAGYQRDLAITVLPLRQIEAMHQRLRKWVPYVAQPQPQHQPQLQSGGGLS